MEGAGSPVELNLMARDLTNLRPVRHLDGRWLLVGDIDRGGIFAQLAGTWALLPKADRARGLGAIVNRFRGDPALFPDPQSWLAPHAPGFAVLGTVPLRRDLQPEEEDGLSPADEDRGRATRSPGCAPRTPPTSPTASPGGTTPACASAGPTMPACSPRPPRIVLPGSKNSIADLRWLRAHGLDRAIQQAAARGAAGGRHLRRLPDARRAPARSRRPCRRRRR